MPDPGWGTYLAEYHDSHPGITEDLLLGACDRGGRSPYDWLLEAVPTRASVIVDLACGSAPMSRLLEGGRPDRCVVGVDQSAGELARARAAAPCGLVARALATAVPIASAAADAVVSSMALMLMKPVEGVLAEACRLLRAGGTFAATVPTRSRGGGVAPEAPAFARILDDLGQDGTAYPEPFEARNLVERFSASGLSLRQDETCLFVRTVSGPDDAELVVRSFYAPGAPCSRVAAAVADFQSRVVSGPLRIGYRIRRLVAVR